MNLFYENALAMKDEMVENRRMVHQFAETGFALEKTVAFVMKKLESYGLSPERVGRAGVSATIGHGGKVILLRADMDALPMQEETELDFAAKNGNCHSCGHDSHTAMLLAAAKLLSERKDSLPGTVKLMLQPAEELLAGAKDMIEAGILENPNVDAALALHINVAGEKSAVGEITYARGPANYSGDAVKITVKGREAHGSMPEKGVDAISIASHIVLALQEVIAREIPCTDHAVLIVGKISGGATCNTLCGLVELECSVRATTQEKRAFLKERLKEVAENTARTFRGEAIVEFVYGIAPMVTDVAFSDEIALYAADIVPAEKIFVVPTAGGTEDFSAIAERVPAAYLRLGAGSPQEGYTETLHNPRMTFSEEAMPIGASLYAHAAFSYLQAHK